MKNKRLAALATAMAMVTAIASGCSKNSGSTSESDDYSGQTITGEVTVVDGDDITIALGEIKEAEDSSSESEDDNSGESEPTEATDTSDNSNDSRSMPSGQSQGDGEAPSGQAPGDGEMPSGQAPGDGEMPSGQAPGGNMPGDSSAIVQYEFEENGDTATIDVSSVTTITVENDTDDEDDTVDEIQVGDILEITFDEEGSVSSITVKSLTESSSADMMPNGDFTANAASGGSSSASVDAKGATTITEDSDIESESYSSTGDDENALLIDGATVSLSGITADKSGGESSSSENGDFYGINAAVLATNGATVTIDDATVTSDAANGNGIFSYGDGTTVNISDSSITTVSDNSGGIMTTGGGTTNATNLTVDTSGNSSAAIRSDRGGGTVKVSGGTYSTHGTGSPAIYSTADITADSATLTATKSEALVIEGCNSIALTDCNVTSTETETASSDGNFKSVMIYQSQSGDADTGESSFSMTGGSLTCNSGDTIYVTNTACSIYMNGVDITNNDTDGVFLRIIGNGGTKGWGTAGSNGGTADVVLEDQQVEGDIAVDTISQMNLTLKGASTLTGTINIADNADGGTAVDDNAVVTIDKGSTWELTGNCTVTSLTNNGTIIFNGYTITLADGTVLSK